MKLSAKIKEKHFPTRGQTKLCPVKRALRDQVGIIIYRHLGSKNSSYPSNSYDSQKFVELAEDLAQFIERQESGGA